MKTNVILSVLFFGSLTFAQAPTPAPATPAPATPAPAKPAPTIIGTWVHVGTICSDGSKPKSSKIVSATLVFNADGTDSAESVAIGDDGKNHRVTFVGKHTLKLEDLKNGKKGLILRGTTALVEDGKEMPQEEDDPSLIELSADGKNMTFGEFEGVSDGSDEFECPKGSYSIEKFVRKL
jgi:hypothetical protein